MTEISKEKQREYTRRYRERHPGRAKKAHRRWVERNREKANAIQREYYQNNKEKCLARDKAYRNKHKDRIYAQQRAYKWKRTYGVSEEDVSAMAEQQGGLCPGCQKELVGSICIDHCHASGRVRGLLCRSCNWAIGHVRDNPATLIRLATYLSQLK